MNERIKKDLLKSGAAVVGFALVKDSLDDDIVHLENAISIGVNRNLNEATVKLLNRLQKKTAQYLKKKGFRYLCIPPDSDRIEGKFISRLYPLFTHRLAATSAGLGWIGRNGLLISPDYGPRLSLATVLTDAPVAVAMPVEAGRCGDCRLCVDFCPSKAITGNSWSRKNPFVELVNLNICSAHKKAAKGCNGKPNCGLCINICPYGRTQKIVKETVLSTR